MLSTVTRAIISQFKGREKTKNKKNKVLTLICRKHLFVRFKKVFYGVGRDSTGISSEKA